MPSGASQYTQPTWIAAGDFTGDGRVDIAVADDDYTYGSVSILVNVNYQGNATFGGPLDFNRSIPGVPSFVAVADINGDGKLDVAVAESKDGNIGVLWGNGNGTLQSILEYPVAGAKWLAMADFSGDRRVDLVVGDGLPEVAMLTGLSSPNTKTITLKSSSPGLTVVVDGVTYTTPRTFEWVPGSTHTIATTSPQYFGTYTDFRYAFTSWSDGGGISHQVTAPQAPATFTVNFKIQYQLTMSVSPVGAGTVTPASGGFYDAGQVVSITAVAGPGYIFSTWSGDIPIGSPSTTAVTMDGPIVAEADFRTSVQITGAVTLQRAANGNYLVTLDLKNTGTGTAQNLTMTSVLISSKGQTPTDTDLPVTIGNLAPNATIRSTYVFAPSVGVPGTSVIVIYDGTYDGGSFSKGLKAVLPN
jgi:hypothetical protein